MVLSRVRSGFHWDVVFAGTERKKGVGRKFSASGGGGVTAFSQGYPQSQGTLTFSILKVYSHLAHVLSQDPSARIMTPRSHSRPSRRWRVVSDTSRAGTGKGGVLAKGLLSPDHQSMSTTKVSSWRNWSGGLITWGMCVNPAPGSRAVLFNRRDSRQYSRNSRRSSSACA